MATLYWKGHAQAVSQVTTLTLAGTITSQTFSLIVGNITLKYASGGSDTASDIATALQDQWNNSTHSYHIPITVSADAAVLTFTADIAGQAFVITAQTTGSANLTFATPTPNAGPNDWSTPENWSSDSIPVNGDTVIFQNNSVPVLYGLDQSTITLAALFINQSYVGKIGLPDNIFTIDTSTTDADACEYRQSYLTISANEIHIGKHAGSSTPSGAGRIKIDTGNNQTHLHIHNTASTPSDNHHQTVQWIGNHADNVVRILRGKLGIASNLPGETTTVKEIYVGSSGSLGSDADVVIGSQTTLDQLYQAGGSIILEADVNTLEQTNGSLTTLHSLALTNVTLAGSTDFQHIGDIANLTLRNTANVDFSKQSTPRSINTCKLHASSTLNLNNGNPLSITFTNGLDCVQCSPDQINVTWWPNVRLAVGAIV